MFHGLIFGKIKSFNLMGEHMFSVAIKGSDFDNIQDITILWSMIKQRVNLVIILREWPSSNKLMGLSLFI